MKSDVAPAVVKSAEKIRPAISKLSVIPNKLLTKEFFSLKSVMLGQIGLASGLSWPFKSDFSSSLRSVKVVSISVSQLID